MVKNFYGIIVAKFIGWRDRGGKGGRWDERSGGRGRRADGR